MSPPPGYVAYGGGNVGAYGSFQRIGGLAKALRVLMLILIPVLVISAILLSSVKSKAEDFVNNSDAAAKKSYDDALAPYALLSIVTGLVTVTVFVLTVLWMFRMAKNQLELRRAGTWGPAWAIAGWFLPPCILYVIPYLMMRDLWKASDPNSGADWKRNPIGLVVHVWWVLFGLIPVAFISVTLGNFRFNANADAAQAAKDVVDRFNVTVAATAVQIAAAVSYLLLVGQLSARHKQTINES